MLVEVVPLLKEMRQTIDSITSSNGQEDHVSMGANAAVKAYKVLKNVQQVIAIELLTAIQALEFRRPLKSSNVIEGVVRDFRKKVSTMNADRVLRDDMILALRFIQNTKPPIETE